MKTLQFSNFVTNRLTYFTDISENYTFSITIIHSEYYYEFGILYYTAKIRFIASFFTASVSKKLQHIHWSNKNWWIGNFVMNSISFINFAWNQVKF